MSQHSEQNNRIMTTTGKTIVITDPKEIIRNVVDRFSKINQRADVCADSNAPYSHFKLKPIQDAYIRLKNRGVKVRFITEITKENLHYSKELMKIVELRHLDGIKGNFGIADGVEYRASPTSKQEEIPSEYIISTMKSFVEQQQYFFDMLWNKAIPVEQRIREIEEGIKPEVIETIRETRVTQERVFELIKSAREEILIIFSTSNAFRRQGKAGAVDFLIMTAKSRV